MDDRRQEQVRRVAEEYRGEGYEVFVDPAPELTPARLAWLRVDLIARRGDDHVLVLVGGGEDGQLRFLADVVSDIPGWRLDVRVLEE